MASVAMNKTKEQSGEWTGLVMSSVVLINIASNGPKVALRGEGMPPECQKQESLSKNVTNASNTIIVR